MKKLLFAALVLSGCRLESNSNRAELMVKAQVPTATCKTTKAGADIALCDIPATDKIVQYIAVYSDKYGFKVYPLEDAPKEGQGQGSHAEPAPPAAPPAPVTPPDAGK